MVLVETLCQLEKESFSARHRQCVAPFLEQRKSWSGSVRGPLSCPVLYTTCYSRLGAKVDLRA